MLVPFKSVGSNVTFFKRSSGFNLGVEISNDDLKERTVFSVELLQMSDTGLKVFELINVSPKLVLKNASATNSSIVACSEEEFFSDVIDRMVTKKKAKKNAAFKKVKLKVGKKLKKTSTTDTTIKTKKVVLLSQLQEKNGTSERPLSYRGLSLDDLCKQLGHFSKSVRNGALVGTKQLLTSRPDLVESHLRVLVPSVARLIPHCGSDPALSGQLLALIRVICNASPHSMTAHFTLFVAHLLHALTHNEARVRSFSLSVIALVLCTYPDLCSKNADLFTAFVKFLGGSHKPRWNSPGFLETIVSFIKAYTADRSNRKDVCTEIQLSMDTGEVSAGVNLLRTFSKSNPFDFPVITSSISTTVSPLEVPESLLSLSEACAPILDVVSS
ncbi:unnamed protein product [Angiostrongylus costaricensis]|uniref:Ipi1_N domain-containing protein n=1 Tax=Angiostrongylus costaricensis TaxID=334426 RepID=A0A158PG13_ANGCS|nr:unnamed protein product [Angiostrongylus costaricensis]